MSTHIDPVSTELEKAFPHLAKVGYAVKSPRTEDYNCVAFALDREDEWRAPHRTWKGILGTDTYTLKIEFYMEGYKDCDTGDVEPGFEKVVLYEDRHGNWVHVAKQTENGWWKSKIGEDEDIIHRTPHAVLNRMYQRVAGFMKRPIKPQSPHREQA